ncbi:MAG: NAD-dependent epimerase/dehydratase family protein [Candidatus Acidiferrales bacterium]
MSPGQAGSEPVAVTGATGFLGRALCKRLQSMGIHVRAAARTPAGGPWSEFVTLDIPGSVPGELFTGVSVVYHLAGRAHAIASEGDAQVYDRVNGAGTAELAQRAKAAGVRRFVFMSSVKALGEPGKDLVREDQESTATDPYGRSKHNGEVAALSLHSADFQVVVLRPTLVYGPGAKGNLESLLRFVRGGRRPPLPRLKNRRSLVGVNDLTTATVLVGTHPEAGGRAYTVTDGRVYSTTDIIDALAAAVGVTRSAPFSLPVPVLRAGGIAGDLASFISAGRWPYGSAALNRLLSNAEYEASGLAQAVGFQPRESLYDLAGPMLHAARRAARI